MHHPYKSAKRLTASFVSACALAAARKIRQLSVVTYAAITSVDIDGLFKRIIQEESHALRRTPTGLSRGASPAGNVEEAGTEEERSHATEPEEERSHSPDEPQRPVLLGDLNLWIWETQEKIQFSQVSAWPERVSDHKLDAPLTHPAKRFNGNSKR